MVEARPEANRELKTEILKKIELLGPEIIEMGRKIYNNPELGFKEVKTADFLTKILKDSGFDVEKGLGLTGFKAELKCSSDKENRGPNIAILGELDSVICNDHPDADPETGAVHACGHNVQAAVMVGLARAFSGFSQLKKLAGKLTFIGVPAEEYIELGYREELRNSGKIKFFGGKQELIRQGVFDDIDIVLMFHLYSNPKGKKVMMGGTANGFIAKFVNYLGQEAHAGAEPHLGINALNACMLGLQAIHMQRETFKEDDYIRVHPIITRGGELVNVIPANVTMETYVRGKTFESILSASKKVDRALQAGAMGVGAEVKIKTIPGYFPQKNCPELNEVFRSNLLEFVEDGKIQEMEHQTGSSDIGDIMHMLPAIHPFIGGAEGNAHSRNFRINDEELAYIVSAKTLASTVIDLMVDGGSLAKDIIKKFKEKNKDTNVLEFWEQIFS